jgi:hypothetical protein
MAKKNKVRGPDGRLYEFGAGEVYEAPEDNPKKPRKKPAQPGKLTPDPHGQSITPEEHGQKVTPEQHGSKIKP